MGVGGQHHASAALFPEKRPVRIVQEAGWAQGLSERVREISPPQGFDPRTVQGLKMETELVFQATNLA
jgi:hypothetical protein